MSPSQLPADAQFKGYREVVIQDLRLEAHNTKFLLERYFSAEQNQWIDAKLPEGYEGTEFGPELRAFVFMLYFQGRVTQNKIERILTGMGVQITDSELSRMLIARQSELDEEHEKARAVALAQSKFVQVDDTGAKILIDHNSSAHTIVTSNPWFCSYRTSYSKDRMSVVQALLGNEEPGFLINRTSLKFLKGSVAIRFLKDLEKWPNNGQVMTRVEFEKKLRRLDPLPKPVRQEIETAAAIAAYRAKEDDRPRVLVSDDAKNFKALLPLHQLCWVHEFRHYRVIYCCGSYQESLIRDHLQAMGMLYKRLKRYKIDPSPAEKQAIEAEFDQLFTAQTPFNALGEQRRLTMKRKKGLLLALNHPYVPLHNNESETDLRERVLKRRISYGNRSWAGVRAWDRQLGILHTCRKLSISYWEFLKDRFQRKYQIASLHRLIPVAA